MLLSEYEARLQSVNPRLRIKRYGTSMAGVHLDNRYICRVPQGEIVANNCFEIRVGQADQYITDFNLTGEYRFKYMTRRGRAETARVLYTARCIKFDDIAKLS